MTRSTKYILGYVLSLVLTVLPLVLVWLHEAGRHQFPTHEMLYVAFVVFAVLQLVVQLYFFLHLDEEKRPRWNLVALSFALLVVAIVVGGTLWIMHNLSYAHEGPQPFIGTEITPQTEND